MTQQPTVAPLTGEPTVNTADAAVPASTAVADQPAHRAITAAAAIAGAAEAAGPTVAAVTQQPGRATVTGKPAVVGADTAIPTVPAAAEKPGMAAVTARSPVAAAGARSTDPAHAPGAAVAEQADGVAAGPAGPTIGTQGQRSHAARPPGATAAEQQSSGTTRTARFTDHRGGCARAAGPAGSAVADQPGRTAVAATLTRSAGAAVAAVAVEQATRPTVLPGVGQPVGAIADQRAAQHGLRGRIDRIEHVLLHGLQSLKRRRVGCLGARVGGRTRAERPNELVVESDRLGTQRLICPRVRVEQRGDDCRHLVGTGGQHPRGRECGGSVGRADRGANAREVRRGCRNHCRRRDHKGHRYYLRSRQRREGRAGVQRNGARWRPGQE